MRSGAAGCIIHTRNSCIVEGTIIEDYEPEGQTRTTGSNCGAPLKIKTGEYHLSKRDNTGKLALGY
jgi:hypothetical protein